MAGLCGLSALAYSPHWTLIRRYLGKLDIQFSQASALGRRFSRKFLPSCIDYSNWDHNESSRSLVAVQGAVERKDMAVVTAMRRCDEQSIVYSSTGPENSHCPASPETLAVQSD